MFIKPVQPENAPLLNQCVPLPILVTVLGIVILVKPVQPANAPFSILVTLSGIVILVKLPQPEKELFGILVPPLITTVFNDAGTFDAKFPNIETNVWLTAGKVMFVKPLQFWNALLPILITLFGIVILVKPVQPEKALLLIILLPVTMTVFNDIGTTKFWVEAIDAPKIKPK